MYSREHHFLTLTWTANWKRRLLFYFISVSYHISCIQIDWSNSSMRSQCGTKMEHQTATIWRCDPSGRWNEALGRVSCASPVPVTFVKPSGSTNRSLTCDPVRMWQHWKKSILFTLMEQKTAMDKHLSRTGTIQSYWNKTQNTLHNVDSWF